MEIFLARFEGPGPAVEQRRIGGDPREGTNLLAKGFVPIVVPSWVNYGEWLAVRSLANGGVEFEFPAHVRNWEGFKDALIADQRSQEITAAAFAHPALGTALTLFLAAIDTLEQRATPERLITFQRMWLAFRSVLESLMTAQVLEAGIVDEIKAIALTFDIELLDTLPEPEESQGESNEPN
ncbi:MAG: hypothetical protein AAGF75_05185 [Cyanobacteria bacterium P01_H01_bin.130]